MEIQLEQLRSPTHEAQALIAELEQEQEQEQEQEIHPIIRRSNGMGWRSKPFSSPTSISSWPG